MSARADRSQQGLLLLLIAAILLLLVAVLRDCRYRHGRPRLDKEELDPAMLAACPSIAIRAITFLRLLAPTMSKVGRQNER